jgi:hypothetical protein
MSRIILAHPYSGALYRFFSDQIGGEWSHSRIVAGHSYYKTLYGRESLPNIELALSFLLLHDEVWVAPADNHWPKSRLNPEDRARVAELGLTADWTDFMNGDYMETRRAIEVLLVDPRLQATLGKVLRLPKKSWSLAINYALYEAGLSARKRIPILCSPGRRQLISTLVEIQRPSLHPLFTPSAEISFVETYRSATGLALAPRTLDDLMDAKPDPSVRKYAKAFTSVVEAAGAKPKMSQKAFAKVALEAISTERVAKCFAGTLNWSAAFLRLTGEPMLGGLSAGASYLAGRGAQAYGWYEFRGSIDRAVTQAQFVRRLEAIVKSGASDA